jgi:glycosyltransferase involved in cell wall biosynthesis
MEIANNLKKIAIICSPGNDNHLSEISDHFKANYETKICITNDQEQIFNALKWADIVWIEWADQSAINVTRFERLLFQKQVILRLHSYEAFTQYLDYIKWSTITDLIFVADHIKDVVLKKYPKIVNNVDRIHVIPNGIDIDRFKLSRETTGKDLAYLGYLNFKKAPVLLFTAFAELLKLDPIYRLHIAGEFQENRYTLYLEQMQKQNPLLAKQVKFCGWVEKPEEWLKDKSHIICTSVLESQGKGIMEAMAMGLKPVIHNFVGADTIYPKKYIWNTASEFCEMVLSNEYRPEEYRKYITENYSTQDKIKRIESVIAQHSEFVPVFMPDDLVKPATLSVVMIMRNEEKYIGRCLESVKDIADEIIIVDTGSVDKSIEIAESYGAKIYHYPWQDNFSLHRNQSIDYATGDWLLQIDADEELVGDKQGLKKTLARISSEYNGVSVKLQDVCQESGTQFNASRIFRKGKIKYKRAVHNMPIYEGAGKFGAVLFDGVTIIHHGSYYQISAEESKKKADRTGSLLHKALKEDPEDYELFFYLMQFYGTIEDYGKAIDYGEQYLAKKNQCDGFNDSVYYTIIRLNIEKKNYERAYCWLREAQILLPDDLDVSFVATELGVITGNGQLLLQGARNYIKQYEIFEKRPDAKGSRFIFSQKPDSLYFVLKHMTSYLLSDGVNCLDQLKKSIGFLTEADQAIAAEEVKQILEPIGISTN